MKIHKKLAKVLVVAATVSSSCSGLYANESLMGQKAVEFSRVDGVRYDASTKNNTTVQQKNEPPQISNVRTKTIDSKLCLIFTVKDSDGIKFVEVDSKSATKYSGSSTNAEYYIEIKEEGTYKIYAEDKLGKGEETRHTVTINDNKKPEVELSQTFKNGDCYLVVKISDNGTIASVTVNGTSKSFRADGGTESYKVTKSGTYKVVVKDAAGNTTTEKFEVDIDAKAPTLKLDKVYKNNKWYLTIEVKPRGSADISKVTVNGSSVSCKAAGQTIEYPVSSTGTYKVVAKDNFGQETSESLYIDTNVNNSANKPTLTVVQSNMGNVVYLVITAKPSTQITNNKLASVTVNGNNVNFSAAGGTVSYPVAGVGSYTVVAKDINGNETSQTYYVTSPVTQQGVNTTQGSSNVVFTLNQKTWIKNGVAQTMDAAPTSKYGRIYIPIRYVAYALNIDPSQVTWDAKTKTATINESGNVVKVSLGSRTMKVNGVSQTMEAEAITYNQRIYIPISQVAKAFKGVTMQWDNSSKQVRIQR